MKDSWGNQVQGGGDRNYLATLNTAQPYGIGEKGVVTSPISMTTGNLPPTLVERKTAPYVSLEAFSLKDFK